MPIEMTSIATNYRQRGPAPRNSDWTDDWQTPPEIIEPLGRFDLDPSASLHQIHRTARTMWTITDQGFLRQWFGRVWLNPPYGKHTSEWMRRLSEHGNGIALVYLRSDTVWFQTYVFPIAHALFFFKGRLAFIRPDGQRPIHNAGGPSVLIAYGAYNALLLKSCGLPGKYVALKKLTGLVG
jgi:hypothetical protein